MKSTSLPLGLINDSLRLYLLRCFPLSCRCVNCPQTSISLSNPPSPHSSQSIAAVPPFHSSLVPLHVKMICFVASLLRWRDPPPKSVLTTLISLFTLMFFVSDFFFWFTSSHRPVTGREFGKSHLSPFENNSPFSLATPSIAVHCFLF